MDKQVGAWTGRWMDEWMNRCVGGWMREWVSKWMSSSSLEPNEPPIREPRAKKWKYCDWSFILALMSFCCISF